MSHLSSRQGTDDLRLVFLLNLSFTIVEIAGGFWTNSVAILSDAVHDLGDSLALGAAWYLERYAQRGSNRRFSYGYRRFSLLGAWTTTVVLIVGGIFILSEAIPRLFQPEMPHAPGMLFFAMLGISANSIAALRLRGRRSLNTRVAFWHLIEDVLGWVAVFVIAIVLLIVDFPVLDPVLSILITAYILFNVFRHVRQTFLLFLQAVPEDIDLVELRRRLNTLTHVRSTHHTHVWSLDGSQHVLTTHIVVDNVSTKTEVSRLRADVAQLCEEYGFAHTTVEIEWGDNECRMTESVPSV